MVSAATSMDHRQSGLVAGGEAEDEDLGDVDQDEPGDDGGEGSDAAEATRALEVEMLIQEMQAMEAAKANGARLMLGLVTPTTTKPTLPFLAVSSEYQINTFELPV